MPPRFVSAEKKGGGKEEDGEGKKIGEEERKDRVEMRGGGGGGPNAEHQRGGREAVCKWIIRKAQLKDNFYFINAAKLHYCSHTQSYCPHSRRRPRGGEKSRQTEQGRRYKMI